MYNNEQQTDRALLKNAFGKNYLLLQNTGEDNMPLAQEQRQALTELIDERDHYGIAVLLNTWRKAKQLKPIGVLY